MLKLDRRDGTIGNSIQTRGEEHGDETLPAKDIPLTFTVSRTELGEIIREPLVGESFFNDKAGFAEPLYGGKIAPVKILGKFENCKVVITVGIDETEIALENAVLARLEFDALAGGRFSLKFQVQYHPRDSDNVSLLEKWLNHDCKIQVDVGKLAKPKNTEQQNLPLGDPSVEANESSLNLDADADGDDLADAQAVKDAVNLLDPPADIGTPEENREAARNREREIAQQIEADRDDEKPKRRGRKPSQHASLN